MARPRPREAPVTKTTLESSETALNADVPDKEKDEVENGTGENALRGDTAVKRKILVKNLREERKMAEDYVLDR